MASLSDLLSFEAFNLKDMWKKIKDDPERLFLGAFDPFSSEMWGKITGKDYEPIVDQMGGAYGGHTFSAFGNTDGGVYGRAEEAGINTETGRNAQNVAHVIAAILAGNYGLGKLPQGMQGGQQQGWQQYTQGMPGQQQQQQQQQRPPPPPNFYEEAQRRAMLKAQEDAARRQMAAQLARVHKVGG